LAFGVWCLLFGVWRLKPPSPTLPPKGEGSLGILKFRILKKIKKLKTENASNLLNALNLLNLLNNSLMPKTENTSNPQTSAAI
jgi:hypothetical protein